jgi:N-acetylglucosamine-6-phosphate deacetylase
VYEEASKQNIAGSTFLGVHLEGPYFAMNQRGAQDPKYIRNPDPEEYKEVIASSKQIRRWSAAPELKGAIELGNYLCINGILPAIAHTDALYEEVMDAFENGYELVTHLYSAMSGVTRRDAYRYAGTIESAFLIDGLSVEIVADGKHLPAPLLKLVYKIKGADRIVLVTDAMRAAGENTTESVLGNIRSGLKVIIEDGVAKLPDRSAFAGSVATADRLVRTMINIADVPLYDAVKMMTATPAAIMKISNKKGSLRRGKDADIIIFDKDINVNMTMVEGKIVYTQP